MTKIVFGVSDQAISRFNYLKEKAGAKNYAEVVRYALRLYDWAIEEFEAGRTVIDLTEVFEEDRLARPQLRLISNPNWINDTDA